MANTAKPKGTKVADEEKIASWVEVKFKDAMNAKENVTAEWMEYMNAWNNSLYEDESAPDYKTKHISNLIYSTIECMRPIMFDGNPKFESIPVTKEALPYTKSINNIFDYEWERTGMKKKLIANSIYTLCIGTSVIMLTYAYDDNGNPDGDVKPVLVNPFNIFPDPMATSVEDAEYIMYASYVHENVLKQRYPERAEDIEGGDLKYNELASQRNENAKVENQVLLIECWCRDFTSMKEVYGDDGTSTKVPQYPLGRVIICAPELGIVFEDKENPYQSGRFPFFLFKDIEVPFNFWGEGEIKWLLSPQKAINELSSQVIDNAKSTANMQWIVDRNAGIPKGALTNRPGLIVRKNPGTEVRRDQPPAMPMYVSEMISRQENVIEVVSGVHDVTRGENPGRIESGTAILALQEAAQTRIRLKQTLLYETLSELGTEWLSRIKQFWTVDRLIPVKKAESSNMTDYALNGVEIQPQQPMMTDPMNPLGQQPVESEDFTFEEIKAQEHLKQDYRVIVKGASGFVLNRASMLDTMLQLISTPAEDGMPVVPREAVLDYLPDVNKRMIMGYFDKLKQEQMMKEQQALMNNQAMMQLQGVTEGLDETNKQVGSLSQRAQQEDDAKARDEIMAQGYQQGMNEAQAQQNMLDKSGAVPPELLQELSTLSDEELAKVLQDNPELAGMI